MSHSSIDVSADEYLLTLSVRRRIPRLSGSRYRMSSAEAGAPSASLRQLGGGEGGNRISCAPVSCLVARESDSVDDLRPPGERGSERETESERGSERTETD